MWRNNFRKITTTKSKLYIQTASPLIWINKVDKRLYNGRSYCLSTFLSVHRTSNWSIYLRHPNMESAERTKFEVNIYIYIYIYVCVCVRVCACVFVLLYLFFKNLITYRSIYIYILFCSYLAINLSISICSTLCLSLSFTLSWSISLLEPAHWRSG